MMSVMICPAAVLEPAGESHGVNSGIGQGPAQNLTGRFIEKMHIQTDKMTDYQAVARKIQ